MQPGEALPRQTYRTPDDEWDEYLIAERFALWANASQLKFGTDPIDRQKSRIDRLLYRQDTVVALFEVKRRSMEFRQTPAGWITGRRKVEDCRAAAAIFRLPVLLVVEFGCRTVAYLDTATDHTVVPDWGRNDRNDPADREAGARFSWDKFKRIWGPHT